MNSTPFLLPFRIATDFLFISYHFHNQLVRIQQYQLQLPLIQILQINLNLLLLLFVNDSFEFILICNFIGSMIDFVSILYEFVGCELLTKTELPLRRKKSTKLKTKTKFTLPRKTIQTSFNPHSRNISPSLPLIAFPNH